MIILLLGLLFLFLIPVDLCGCMGFDIRPTFIMLAGGCCCPAVIGVGGGGAVGATDLGG